MSGAPSQPKEIVTAYITAGSGLFLRCLDRAWRSRGLAVAHRKHGLVAERTDAGAVAP